MTPEKIQKVVEEYPDFLNKREKLQNRLIKLSGRDPEQELAVLQRLEEVEQVLELIDYAVFENGILTERESCMVEHRLEGRSIKEICAFFSLSQERIRQILDMAYKKIAEAAKMQNIA